MENIPKKTEYQCCFCAKVIESGRVDPCDLNILTNSFKAWEQRNNLSFYCHIQCFKSKLHKDCRRYLVVDILDNE